MKQQIVLIAYLCCAALVYALPVSETEKELDVINIPLSNGKELDVLTLGDADTMNERNKRTIGILRDLFPEISKQVEDQVNKLVAQLLRTLGPTVLRTAIQGNTATRTRNDFDSDFDDDDATPDDDDSSSTSGTRVKIDLPTFDGDDDDDKTTTSTTAKSSNKDDDDDDKTSNETK